MYRGVLPSCGAEKHYGQCHFRQTHTHTRARTPARPQECKHSLSHFQYAHACTPKCKLLNSRYTHKYTDAPTRARTHKNTHIRTLSFAISLFTHKHPMPWTATELADTTTISGSPRTHNAAAIHNADNAAPCGYTRIQWRDSIGDILAGIRPGPLYRTHRLIHLRSRSKHTHIPRYAHARTPTYPDTRMHAHTHTHAHPRSVSRCLSLFIHTNTQCH
jgi:hypothetical protein